MPVKSMDFLQTDVFCTEKGAKAGRATPPSVAGHSARFLGEIWGFGEGQQLDQFARIALGHQGLAGADLISRLHH